jgi:hypothetical protein
MFAHHLFSLIQHLMSTSWARDFEERFSPYGDTCAARLGPFQLEVYGCFVLDHADATIYLCMPSIWGKLHLGYRVCKGEEQIRLPGFYAYRQQALPQVMQPPTDPDEPSPL